MSSSPHKEKSANEILLDACNTQEITPELKEITRDVQRLTHSVYFGRPDPSGEFDVVETIDPGLGGSEQAMWANFQSQRKQIAAKHGLKGAQPQWITELKEIKDGWHGFEEQTGVDRSIRKPVMACTVVPEKEIVLGGDLYTCVKLPVRWPRSVCLSRELPGALVKQIRMGVPGDEGGDSVQWLPFLVAVDNKLLESFPYLQSLTWSAQSLTTRQRQEMDSFREKIQTHWGMEESLWDEHQQKVSRGEMDLHVPPSDRASLHQLLPVKARAVVDFNFHAMHAVFPHALQHKYLVVDTVELAVRDRTRADLPLMELQGQHPHLVRRECIQVIREKRFRGHPVLLTWDRCRYHLPLQPEILLPTHMTVHKLHLEIPRGGTYDYAAGDACPEPVTVPVTLHNRVDFSGVRSRPGNILYPGQPQDEAMDDPEMVFSSDNITPLHDPSWEALRAEDTGDVNLHAISVDPPVIRCLSPLPTNMHRVRCWIHSRMSPDHPIRLFYDEQQRMSLEGIAKLEVDPAQVHGVTKKRAQRKKKAWVGPEEEGVKPVGRVLKRAPLPVKNPMLPSALPDIK